MKPASAGDPAKTSRAAAAPGTKPGAAALGQDASREAKQRAAAILEVLAGVRTPAQAATALGLSLPGYYQWEHRALRGLLEACQPRPRGRVRSVDSELATLRREQQRLQREVARQQALVRLAQRTLGLPPPAAPKAAQAGTKRRRRRPTARALHVAERLQREARTAAAESDCPMTAAPVP
jgi:hypothetical protein